MSKLSLSFISGMNERVEPLFDGSVTVEGVELIATRSDPSETFWRQLTFQEFEIAEMSLSSYLIARSRGMDMIAIPVFLSRRFMHMELSYHVNSGIKDAGDLAGKRVGIGEYQQTASLWLRGVRLFPDVIAEGTRFFKKHGYIPANHAYVIRGDMDRKYPWLAFNLFKAFVAARELAQDKLPGRIPSGLIFGSEYLRMTKSSFGEDPYPYGLSANREMLQTIVDYSVEQGLTKEKQRLVELFAPSTLEL